MKHLNIGIEEVVTNENLAVGNEASTAAEQVALAKVFGLALALATEPSKLAQLGQMLAQLQQQGDLSEDFSCWAIECIDARVMSMALEYAHDAEVLVQILSFQGGTFASFMRVIEDLYRHKQISQRVYVKAKLLLRANEPPQQERRVP